MHFVTPSFKLCNKFYNELCNEQIKTKPKTNNLQ